MVKPRKSHPAQPKLTGRTRFQVKAAEKYLDDLVAATTSSTVTFTELRNRDWIAARVAAAISEAQDAGRKGDSVALHSLQRAMVEQWDDTLSTGAVAAIHEGEAEPVKAAKATKAPKAVKAPKAPKAVKAPKADAAGKVTAELPAGYELRWPHGSYDLWKQTDKAVEGPAWLVVCNAHGSFMAAANAKAGDVLGSKAGRASWCTGCR